MAPTRRLPISRGAAITACTLLCVYLFERPSHSWGLTDPPHGALAQSHPLTHGIFRHVVAGSDDQFLLIRLVDGQFAARHTQQADGARQDRLEELGELQFAGEIGERVQQGLLFRGLLAFGGEQARVLDGDGRLGREQVEQPQVGLAELARWVGVDAGDGTHQPAADEQRCHHHRLHRGLRVLVRAPFPFLVVGDDERLPGDRDVPHPPFAHGHPRPDRVGLHVVAGDDDQLLGHLVVDGQLTAGDAQQRDGALEHHLEQSIQLQLAGKIGQGGQQRPLFGGPLAFRLQQPRPPDGDAGLIGRRGQNLEVALVERPRPVPLHDQFADGALTGAQRDLQLGDRTAAVAELAGAGLEHRLEVRRAGEEQADALEPERLLAQPLHHAAAHLILVLGLGDPGAEVEQRRSHPGDG
jgi:hypothetical protein